VKKLLCAALLATSLSANAGTILLTKFEYSGGHSEMATNLQSMGHTVDIVDTNGAGLLALALSAKQYDQVYIWDVSTTSFFNQADLNAIGNFWNPSKGIVVDTRSYGYYFQPNNTSEKALLKNVATNLERSGGGLWIGSDHAPEWARNANSVLSHLGFSAIQGSYSNPVNYADPTSVLLNGVDPSQLWGGGNSVGKAPIGVQPNGVEMFIHFGNMNGGNILPYISASFDLQGPTPSVNAPGTVALFMLAGAALLMRQRRQA